MAYKDKKDQAKAAKKHYEKNKNLIKKRAYLFKKEARIRNKQFVKNYLLDKKCVDCGFSDIRALDFDHVRGDKINSVSAMARRAVSINTLKKEIDKCAIRCANCHRIKNHETIWL
ncbi:hypothetical protein N9948_00900 [bacterium]|nr:hypothetical protein [bacterium]